MTLSMRVFEERRRLIKVVGWLEEKRFRIGFIVFLFSCFRIFNHVLFRDLVSRNTYLLNV